MNAPKQREEREEKVKGHVLMKLLHDVAKALDIPVDSTYGEFREALKSLRTHSPEEPVGWLVLGTWDDSGKSGAEVVTNGRLDTQEAAEREAAEWARIAPNVTYTVHPVGKPIGQPLDGEEESTT